jgi:hypothetical protein
MDSGGLRSAPVAEPAYERFTEGLGTPDLAAAKRLLATLR